MQTVSPEVSELISQLDPKVDYGERTFEQVKDLIISGDIIIGPGQARPTLKDRTSGLALKGTGNPVYGLEANKRAKLQQRLLDAAEPDFPEVYSALMEQIGRGDVRAIKLWFEMVIGRAPEMKPTGDQSLMERMFDMILQQKQTTVREIIIDQTP